MGAEDQGPPASHDPGRLTSAQRDRLDALHTLAPLGGWPVRVVHVFLFAACSDAELDTAAQAHEAQARQLRDPHVRAALRQAWEVVDPLRFIPGMRDAAAPLAELLALAPPELAATVQAELAAAGLDPDATGWPPL